MLPNTRVLMVLIAPYSNQILVRAYGEQFIAPMRLVQAF